MIDFKKIENMKNFKFTGMDLYIFLISLESISYKTPLGLISFANLAVYFSSFYFLLFKRNIDIKISIPLILLSTWYTFLSTFQGSSIIGNLSRCWALIILGITLPRLIENKDKFISALRKILYFHCGVMILDFFFNLPWRWSNNALILGLSNTPNTRPSGLFAEPSFFSIFICCILLLIVISRKIKPLDLLISGIACFMTNSVTGVIGFISIYLVNIFENRSYIFNFIRSSFSTKKLLHLSIPFLIVIGLIASYDKGQNFVLSKLLNYKYSNSVMARTHGVYHTFRYTMQRSPFIGFGLGSETLQNTLESFEPQFIEEVPNSITRAMWNASNIDNFSKPLWERHLTPLHKAAIMLSATNSFVYLLLSGGIVALFLFIFYIIYGIGINIYLIPYVILLSCTGTIWFTILFLMPSFVKIIRRN